jgi:hypothetical protein
MTKPQGYSVAGMIVVFVGWNRYFVDLMTETVLCEVQARNGRTIYRKVISRRIETACLLRASDRANEATVAPCDPAPL